MTRRFNSKNSRRTSQDIDPAIDAYFDEMSWPEQAYAFYTNISQDLEALEEIETGLDMDGLPWIEGPEGAYAVFDTEDMRDYIGREWEMLEEEGELSEEQREDLEDVSDLINMLKILFESDVPVLSTGNELEGTMIYAGETWYFFK